MDDRISGHLSALAERIRAVRADMGLSQRDFGMLGGVGLTTQQAYEKATTAPNAEYLYRLLENGINLGTLMDGSPSTSAPASQVPALSIGGIDQDDLENLVKVDEVDLAYGMGAAFTHDAVAVRSHLLPKALIEAITNTPASQLTIARGRGDSMMPTLHDGDMVIIDRSQRTVRDQDAIWALTVGDVAMIKRLRVKSDRVLLLSDNDRVPPDYATHDEVNIVGRVIFVGKRI